jgi:hypothetical protein
MKFKTTNLLITLVFILSMVSACEKPSYTINPIMPPTIEPDTVTDATVAPVETVIPIEEQTSTSIVDSNALPPDPQIVTITTEDNFTLTGYYYPAAIENAPVVVLMHWMKGDHNDWNEVAVWLQNRGLKNPFENPGDAAQFRWWDPSWFPTILQTNPTRC